MHLHGLKILILVWLIIDIAKTSSLGEGSTKTYFKEVADFDDIVEETDKRQNSKKSTTVNNVTMAPDLLEIHPQQRVKQNVNYMELQNDNFNENFNKRDRFQNQIDRYPIRSQYVDQQQHIEPKFIFTKQLRQPIIYRKPAKLNLFNKPELYVIRRLPSQGQYYLFRDKSRKDNYLNEEIGREDRKLDANFIQRQSEENYEDLDAMSTARTENMNFENEEISGIEDARNPENCDTLYQLFKELPLINKMLNELMEDKSPKTFNTAWRSIKCVVNDQQDNEKSRLLDSPGSKICFRKFVRSHRRRRRHSTYLNSRNKRKRINNSLAKRNAEDDPRFKNIIDFIIKNKIFLDTYTYVPIVFSKITQEKPGQQTEATNTANKTTMSADQLAKLSCAECSNQDKDLTTEAQQTSTASKRGVEQKIFGVTPTRESEHHTYTISNISDIMRYIFAEMPRDLKKQQYVTISEESPSSKESFAYNEVYTNPTYPSKDVESVVTERFIIPSESESNVLLNTIDVKREDKPASFNPQQTVVATNLTVPIPTQINTPPTPLNNTNTIINNLTPAIPPVVAAIPISSVPVTNISIPALTNPVQPQVASITPIAPIAPIAPVTPITPISNVPTNTSPALSIGEFLKATTPIILVGSRNISEDIYFRLPELKRTLNQTAKIINDRVKRKICSTTTQDSSTPLVISGMRNISEEVVFKIPNFKRAATENPPGARLKKDVDREEYEEFEDLDYRNPDKRTAPDLTSIELLTTCIPVGVQSNTTVPIVQLSTTLNSNQSVSKIFKINETVSITELTPTENTDLGAQMFEFGGLKTNTIKTDNTTIITTPKIENITLLNNSSTTITVTNVTSNKSIVCSNETLSTINNTIALTTTNNTVGSSLNKSSDTNPIEVKNANATVVGAAKSENGVIQISNKASSPSNTDKQMIPGVLIYPKSEKPTAKSKRSVLDELDVLDTFTNSPLSEIESITIEDPLLNINKKYIDFNPLGIMKKEAHVPLPNETGNCQKETEMILDTLNSLNLNPTSSSTREISSTAPVATSAVAGFNDQSNNLNSPSTSLYNFNVNPAGSDSTPLAQQNFNWNSNLQPIPPVPVSWQVTPNLNQNPLLMMTNIPLNEFNSPSTFSTLLETISISSTHDESTTIASTESSKISLSTGSNSADNKLEKLEKDLKLVNEVQSIIDGMYRMKHKVKKRDVNEVLADSTAHVSTTQKSLKVNPDKFKEIMGLGKILKWKYLKNEHRKKRKLRKKRKRQRKRVHPFRHRRFLGTKMPTYAKFFVNDVPLPFQNYLGNSRRFLMDNSQNDNNNPSLIRLNKIVNPWGIHWPKLDKKELKIEEFSTTTTTEFENVELVPEMVDFHPASPEEINDTTSSSPEPVTNDTTEKTTNNKLAEEDDQESTIEEVETQSEDTEIVTTEISYTTPTTTTQIEETVTEHNYPKKYTEAVEDEDLLEYDISWPENVSTRKQHTANKFIKKLHADNFEHQTRPMRDVFATFTAEDPFKWPSRTPKKKKKGNWRDKFSKYKTSTIALLPTVTWKNFNFTEEQNPFKTVELTQTEPTTTTLSTARTKEVSINFTINTPLPEDIFDYDVLTTPRLLIGNVNLGGDEILSKLEPAEDVNVDLDIAALPLEDEALTESTKPNDELDFDVDKALKYATEGSVTTMEDDDQERREIFQIADELLEDFTSTTTTETTTVETMETFPSKINDNTPSTKKQFVEGSENTITTTSGNSTSTLTINEETENGSSSVEKSNEITTESSNVSTSTDNTTISSTEIASVITTQNISFASDATTSYLITSTNQTIQEVNKTEEGDTTNNEFNITTTETKSNIPVSSENGTLTEIETISTSTKETFTSSVGSTTSYSINSKTPENQTTQVLNTTLLTVAPSSETTQLFTEKTTKQIDTSLKIGRATTNYSTSSSEITTIKPPEIISVSTVPEKLSLSGYTNMVSINTTEESKEISTTKLSVGESSSSGRTTTKNAGSINTTNIIEEKTTLQTTKSLTSEVYLSSESPEIENTATSQELNLKVSEESSQTHSKLFSSPISTTEVATVITGNKITLTQTTMIEEPTVISKKSEVFKSINPFITVLTASATTEMPTQAHNKTTLYTTASGSTQLIETTSKEATLRNISTKENHTEITSTEVIIADQTINSQTHGTKSSTVEPTREETITKLTTVEETKISKILEEISSKNEATTDTTAKKVITTEETTLEETSTKQTLTVASSTEVTNTEKSSIKVVTSEEPITKKTLTQEAIVRSGTVEKNFTESATEEKSSTKEATTQQSNTIIEDTTTNETSTEESASEGIISISSPNSKKTTYDANAEKSQRKKSTKRKKSKPKEVVVVTNLIPIVTWKMFNWTKPELDTKSTTLKFSEKINMTSTISSLENTENISTPQIIKTSSAEPISQTLQYEESKYSTENITETHVSFTSSITSEITTNNDTKSTILSSNKVNVVTESTTKIESSSLSISEEQITNGTSPAVTWQTSEETLLTSTVKSSLITQFEDTKSASTSIVNTEQQKTETETIKTTLLSSEEASSLDLITSVEKSTEYVTKTTTECNTIVTSVSQSSEETDSTVAIPSKDSAVKEETSNSFTGTSRQSSEITTSSTETYSSNKTSSSTKTSLTTETTCLSSSENSEDSTKLQSNTELDKINEANNKFSSLETTCVTDVTGTNKEHSLINSETTTKSTTEVSSSLMPQSSRETGKTATSLTEVLTTASIEETTCLNNTEIVSTTKATASIPHSTKSASSLGGQVEIDSSASTSEQESSSFSTLARKLKKGKSKETFTKSNTSELLSNVTWMNFPWTQNLSTLKLMTPTDNEEVSSTVSTKTVPPTQINNTFCEENVSVSSIQESSETTCLDENTTKIKARKRNLPQTSHASLTEKNVEVSTTETSVNSKLNLNTGKFWKKFSWPALTTKFDEREEMEKQRMLATSTTFKITTRTTTTIKSFLEAEQKSETDFTGLYIPDETTTKPYFSDFFLFTDRTPKEVEVEEIDRKLMSRNLDIGETVGTILPKFSQISDNDRLKLHSAADVLLDNCNVDNTAEIRPTESGLEILTGSVNSNINVAGNVTSSDISKRTHCFTVTHHTTGRPDRKQRSTVKNKVNETNKTCVSLKGTKTPQEPKEKRPTEATLSSNESPKSTQNPTTDRHLLDSTRPKLTTGAFNTVVSTKDTDENWEESSPTETIKMPKTTQTVLTSTKERITKKIHVTTQTLSSLETRSTEIEKTTTENAQTDRKIETPQEVTDEDEDEYVSQEDETIYPDDHFESKFGITLTSTPATTIELSQIEKYVTKVISEVEKKLETAGAASTERTLSAFDKFVTEVISEIEESIKNETASTPEEENSTPEDVDDESSASTFFRLDEETTTENKTLANFSISLATEKGNFTKSQYDNYVSSVIYEIEERLNRTTELERFSINTIRPENSTQTSKFKNFTRHVMTEKQSSVPHFHTIFKQIPTKATVNKESKSTTETLTKITSNKENKSTRKIETHKTVNKERTSTIPTEATLNKKIKSTKNIQTEESVNKESKTSEATTSEATSSEASTSEATSSEATTSDASTSKATTSEATTSEATTSEATTSEATTSEATTSEATTSEATTSEATTSEATTSEATTSEATTSEATTSEATTSEATTSEATTNEATTNEATTNETTTSETTTREISTEATNKENKTTGKVQTEASVNKGSKLQQSLSTQTAKLSNKITEKVDANIIILENFTEELKEVTFNLPSETKSTMCKTCEDKEYSSTEVTESNHSSTNSGTISTMYQETQQETAETQSQISSNEPKEHTKSSESEVHLTTKLKEKVSTERIITTEGGYDTSVNNNEDITQLFSSTFNKTTKIFDESVTITTKASDKVSKKIKIKTNNTEQSTENQITISDKAETTTRVENTHQIGLNEFEETSNTETNSTESAEINAGTTEQKTESEIQTKFKESEAETTTKSENFQRSSLNGVEEISTINLTTKKISELIEIKIFSTEPTSNSESKANIENTEIHIENTYQTTENSEETSKNMYTNTDNTSGKISSELKIKTTSTEQTNKSESTTNLEETEAEVQKNSDTTEVNFHTNIETKTVSEEIKPKTTSTEQASTSEMKSQFEESETTNSGTTTQITISNEEPSTEMKENIESTNTEQTTKSEYVTTLKETKSSPTKSTEITKETLNSQTMQRDFESEITSTPEKFLTTAITSTINVETEISKGETDTSIFVTTYTQENGSTQSTIHTKKEEQTNSIQTSPQNGTDFTAEFATNSTQISTETDIISTAAIVNKFDNESSKEFTTEARGTETEEERTLNSTIIQELSTGLFEINSTYSNLINEENNTTTEISIQTEQNIALVNQSTVSEMKENGTITIIETEETTTTQSTKQINYESEETSKMEINTSELEITVSQKELYSTEIESTATEYELATIFLNETNTISKIYSETTSENQSETNSISYETFKETVRSSIKTKEEASSITIPIEIETQSSITDLHSTSTEKTTKFSTKSSSTDNTLETEKSITTIETTKYTPIKFNNIEDHSTQIESKQGIINQALTTIHGFKTTTEKTDRPITSEESSTGDDNIKEQTEETSETTSEVSTQNSHSEDTTANVSIANQEPRVSDEVVRWTIHSARPKTTTAKIEESEFDQFNDVTETSLNDTSSKSEEKIFITTISEIELNTAVQTDESIINQFRNVTEIETPFEVTQTHETRSSTNKVHLKTTISTSSTKQTNDLTNSSEELNSIISTKELSSSTNTEVTYNLNDITTSNIAKEVVQETSESIITTNTEYEITEIPTNTTSKSNIQFSSITENNNNSNPNTTTTPIPSSLITSIRYTLKNMNLEDEENTFTIQPTQSTEYTEIPNEVEEETVIDLFNTMNQSEVETHELSSETTAQSSESPTEIEEDTQISMFTQSEIPTSIIETSSTQTSTEETLTEEQVTSEQTTERAGTEIEDMEQTLVGIERTNEFSESTVMDEITTSTSSATVEHFIEEAEYGTYQLPHISGTTVCDSCESQIKNISTTVFGKSSHFESTSERVDDESKQKETEIIKSSTEVTTMKENTNETVQPSASTKPFSVKNYTEQLENGSFNIPRSSTTVVCDSCEEETLQIKNISSTNVVESTYFESTSETLNDKSKQKESEIIKSSTEAATVTEIINETVPSSASKLETQASTKQSSVENYTEQLEYGTFNLPRESKSTKCDSCEEETFLTNNKSTTNIQNVITTENSVTEFAQFESTLETNTTEIMTTSAIIEKSKSSTTQKITTESITFENEISIGSALTNSQNPKMSTLNVSSTSTTVMSTISNSNETASSPECMDNILSTLTEPSPTKHHNHESTKSKIIVHKPTTEKQQPKTLVIIVNNSGSKLKKLNESTLEKLVNKTLQEVNLEYIDVSNITENEVTETTTVRKDILIGSNCTQNEFDANSQCVCDVDAYSKVLENKLNSSMQNPVNCTKLISFKEGFSITNDTQPLNRRKRSHLYLKRFDKFTYIENDSLEDVIDGNYRIINSDSSVLAYPGRKAIIYCKNEADKLLDNSSTSFHWEFKRDPQQIAEVLQYHENPLVISSVDTKSTGNYTCMKIDKNGRGENRSHELELMSFPVYKIKLNIYYAINGSCSLSDGDILYAYLPDALGRVLCGQTAKLCKTDMDRPLCFMKDENTYYNVTVSAAMNDIYNIYPSIDDIQCDINCKLEAYYNLVRIVYKNAQIAKRIPVISNLQNHLEFLSNETLPIDDISKPPKIITTCREGYGIEKLKQKFCVLCPKHTYSTENEVYCTVCPAGQYQPHAGSSSCIPCTTPVEDAMCLRMLYSNTKQFKIYVGVGFGLIVVIIALILLWRAGKSDSNETKSSDSMNRRYHRRRSRRKSDVENQSAVPLLANKRRKPAPNVPPPDF
ncbi:unnamed protein product [Phyllotreta striolata]|uniref:Ig-like domain-containing protein n=1 Tax=Phyllotreta striolata TaxID=444603 RepID=A0A9N9TNH5_PHYSR|nr:unnamed protein product [Phyllotreta striolata]